MAGPVPGVRTKRLPPPGELHLTPLHGILQLRPSFSYLDKADAKHREREAANEGERGPHARSVCVLVGWGGIKGPEEGCSAPVASAHWMPVAPTPSVLTTTNIPTYSQMSPGGQNGAQLSTPT